MSMIGPVQSRRHEGSPVGKRSLRWEGFVDVEFYLYPTVGTVLIHSIKPELTE